MPFSPTGQIVQVWIECNEFSSLFLSRRRLFLQQHKSSCPLSSSFFASISFSPSLFLLILLLLFLLLLILLFLSLLRLFVFLLCYHIYDNLCSIVGLKLLLGCFDLSTMHVNDKARSQVT